MTSCACVRIAVIKKRFRMVILRASMSSIVTVLLLPARFGRSLRSNGRNCSGGVVSINAPTASITSPFCKGDTKTVMMVLAFVALVAFPFQEILAEKRHVCDRFLAWRAWLAAASCAFAAS